MFKFAPNVVAAMFIGMIIIAVASMFVPGVTAEQEPPETVSVTAASRGFDADFEFAAMQVVKSKGSKVVLGRDLEQPLLNRHIELLESVGKFYTHSYPTADGHQMVTAFLTLDLEGPHPIAGETVFVQIYKEPACAVVSFYRNPTGEPEAAQSCTAGCNCEFTQHDVPAKNFFANVALEFMRMLQLTPQESN
ncbi:hypothetical protein C4561_00255 [candidate division WWE3 bacterium]|jgi:hypothetical protein|uniref:Uncharacterized protein n=1 Tax=candidate division WWE3 bacterium TaxID=2053526 RepID=A0A3A4ZNJ0_UNCKA|nr:MAG: hypothetical protein C4561_00255 [candidate division WWE3 bacterium]